MEPGQEMVPNEQRGAILSADNVVELSQEENADPTESLPESGLLAFEKPSSTTEMAE